MKPVYPKDNGSLERAKIAFRKKVANWRWDDETEECSYKRRGRKSKPMTKFESKPRTLGEKRAWEKQKLNNKYS
jgi:hypothetical protein